MKPMQISALALFVMLLAECVFAHPPTDVELTFDQETMILTVSASHMVGKITKHYIEKIVVELNDEEIITQRLRIQSSEAKQEVSYAIPGTRVGDTFSVTAYCNIAGKKKNTLLIEEELPDEEE